MSLLRIDLSKKETSKLLTNGKVEKLIDNKMFVITIPDNFEFNITVKSKDVILNE